MESFEELGLDASLVEALAAEGVERPTAFQQGAIPIIRRGNNLVGHVGPGSGALLAYGSALLDRLDVEGGPTRALVLCPTPDAARWAAEAVARLASVTGHSVAALGGVWALPEHATVLFGAPADVLASMQNSSIKLDAVEALVLDQAAPMVSLGALPAVEAILESVPQDAQRVVLALPLGPELAGLVEGHVRRAAHLPPRQADGTPVDDSPQRGALTYVVAGDDRNDTLLETVHAALSEDSRHVLVFFSSDDRAADGGDYLTLHGFMAGAPGDGDAPVWLGVDEREARAALGALDDASTVATVSFDVPGDEDALDRRHGAGGPGIVLVAGREVPHLRDTARRAGYSVSPGPTPVPHRTHTGLQALRARIDGVLADRDLLGEMLLLQPLFDQWSPAEVAAGVLALLRDRERGAGGDPVHAPAVASGRPARQVQPTWVRLFVSIGSRDGVGPGDVVGAISGEAGVTGSQVGKIEIRDTFSLVEVEEAAAEKVIKSLNGTTVRGRSVRVDYDRGSRASGSTRPGPRGPRSGSGSPGPGQRGEPPRGRDGGQRPRRDR